MQKIATIFDRVTTLVQYWFFLGGTIIGFLISLFYVTYSFSDFLIWLVSHFVMVTGLSVGYHRYFAHKSFEVNRFVQFFIGLWGTLCLQRGPLWWTSNHRIHHRFCGTENDPHTPSKGFFTSHFNWTTSSENRKIHWKYIQDLTKYRELYLLEYAYFVIIPGLSLIFYLCGGLPALFAYQLAITTSINTIAAVNSVCHERHDTDCAARNVRWVAFWGAGEGFHGNHHDHPGSAFFGSEWYHFDLSYILIRLMGALGIAKNIRITNSVKDDLRQPTDVNIS